MIQCTVYDISVGIDLPEVKTFCKLNHKTIYYHVSLTSKLDNFMQVFFNLSFVSSNLNLTETTSLCKMP